MGAHFTFTITAALMALSTLAWSDAHNAPLKSFTTTEVKPSMYLLQGKGGNILVHKAKAGLLVIDDDYVENSPLLKKTLNKMGDIQYLINTHWHGDHTGGNKALGGKSTIIAHKHVHKRLSNPQKLSLFKMETEAQPREALPDITYDRLLEIYHGSQHYSVQHFASGHTDGDSVVFINPANMVHMGDHYFNGFFPFVDVENGGDVKGMTRNVNAILKRIDDKTLVIPGHGQLSNKTELKAYVEMLESTTAYIEQQLENGKTVKQIQEKGLPEQWQSWGNGFINEATWIAIVADSLK